MIDSILESFQIYYGLDWLAVLFGLTGTYLLTKKSRWGFALNFFACSCGFMIAYISQQHGLVFHNSVLIGLMAKGFLTWQTA